MTLPDGPAHFLFLIFFLLSSSMLVCICAYSLIPFVTSLSFQPFHILFSIVFSLSIALFLYFALIMPPSFHWKEFSNEAYHSNVFGNFQICLTSCILNHYMLKYIDLDWFCKKRIVPAFYSIFSIRQILILITWSRVLNFKGI